VRELPAQGFGKGSMKNKHLISIWGCNICAIVLSQGDSVVDLILSLCFFAMTLLTIYLGWPRRKKPSVTTDKVGDSAK
jgi:hypothetical protein